MPCLASLRLSENPLPCVPYCWLACSYADSPHATFVCSDNAYEHAQIRHCKAGILSKAYCTTAGQNFVYSDIADNIGTKQQGDIEKMTDNRKLSTAKSAVSGYIWWFRYLFFTYPIDIINISTRFFRNKVCQAKKRIPFPFHCNPIPIQSILQFIPCV